jgi:hypothetical protein
MHVTVCLQYTENVKHRSKLKKYICFYVLYVSLFYGCHVTNTVLSSADEDRNFFKVITGTIIESEKCIPLIMIIIIINSVALVRKRTIPSERLPLVGEVSANFCG